MMIRKRTSEDLASATVTRREELFERRVPEIARFRDGHFAEKSSFSVEEQVTRPRTFEPRAREREPDDPEALQTP